MKKHNYIVTVAGLRGNYKIKCRDIGDLQSYLKALRENKPYFHLINVKRKEDESNTKICQKS